MVVAIVALVVAASGVAVGLPGENRVNSGDVRNNSIRGVDLKNNQVTGRDVRESSLRRVPSAANGVKGILAVSSNGTVNPTLSTTTGTVTLVNTAYCISALPFTPKAGVVSFRDFSGFGGGNYGAIADVGVQPDDLGTTCDNVSGLQARVDVYSNQGAPEFAPAGFTIIFF
jgi:hypothetical protein